MTEALRLIEAALVSPASRTQDIEWALTELGRLVDPELSAPSPQSAFAFDRAFDLLDHLPTPLEGFALAQCLFSMGRYAYISGQAPKGLMPSQRAAEMFRRLGSRPLLRKALSLRGALFSDAGNLPLAIEAYAEALEVAIEMHDCTAEAPVWNNLGVALIYAAQYEDAIGCLERAVTLSQHDERLSWQEGVAYGNIALASLHLEDYARGLLAAQSAVVLQESPCDPLQRFTRVIAEVHYARLLLEAGEPKVAWQRCDIAKRIARESGIERAELLAGMAEGLCEVYSGVVDVGLSRLSKLLELARVLKGTLRDALIAMVKANEIAGRADVALVYLRELMMYTKGLQQESALLHHRLHLEQLERRAELAAAPEALMARREEKLRSQLVQQVAHQELMKARIEILERLAVSTDPCADATGHHSYRVGKLAALLGQALGWDSDTVFLLELAARLHDIGKIGIPEQMLVTKRPLIEREIELVRSHVLIGAQILAQSDLHHMKMAEEIARFHHEHWDGSGYPFGLAYSAIPVAARITALADAFDELTHAQPHEPARSPQDALREIASQRGKRFDPELTDRFVELVSRLRREHRDLDTHLSQAAQESPFIQARQRIAARLRQIDGGGTVEQRQFGADQAAACNDGFR